MNEGLAAAKIKIRGLSAWYGGIRALEDVSIDIACNRLTALVGASGSGKTTVLRCLNQIIDTYKGGRMEGEIAIDGVLVTDQAKNVHTLRRRFGVLAQKPNPFPRSIYDNVAYGPKLHDLAQDHDHLASIVRRHLIRIRLWEEVKDELEKRATSLSVGQQQRLCLARALAYEPEILLLDEPCAALDPINATKVENLIMSLRRDYTIVMVSHHLDLVERTADHVVFLHEGQIIEFGPARTVLTNPQNELTRRFFETQLSVQ